MKALFLIQGFDVPSSRYRILQFLPYWKAAGHEAEVLEHEWALKHRTELLEKAKGMDLVMIHRKRLNPGLIRKLKKTGLRLVYDIDDAVMFRDSLKPGRPNSLIRSYRYNKLVKAIDTVIVGNSYIADHTPVNSHIFPTLLDTSRYEKANHIKEPQQPTIGWIGDGGSLHYLDAKREVLEAIGKQIPNCRLKIICNQFFELKNMEVIKVPWSAETEVKELADISLGWMPLHMDPWSRGKCALKFLQYLAVGRTAVVTPAGMNNDILAQSPCALSATTDDEWLQQTLHLLNQHAERRQMGEQGRQLVQEQYSLEKRAESWIHLLAN